MGFDVIEKHRGIITKALATEDGQALVALLRESFVDVDLLEKTDRDTVAAVARHDLVIYLIEMGGLK